MRTRLAGLAVVLLTGLERAPAGAQNPLRHFTDAVESRYARAQPIVHYTLWIRGGDTTGYDVDVTIRGAPDTFRLTMAKHPEYDDRFFRYVENVRVSPSTARIVHEDSALWRVIAPGGIAVVSYRVQLPVPRPAARGAWRPFLSTTGGLTGGPHSFMYVVGAELAPSHVRVEAPAEWDVATGLTPTSQARTYYAASVYDLVESPMLVGALHRWSFSVDGVPHSVVYWPLPNAQPFDSTALTSHLQRIAVEAVRLFGRAPYREYLFLIQDGAYGALEHPNSVTLGMNSADLAKDPAHDLEEAAHEYFHTWNLMRIRPAEYVGVTNHAIEPVPTLWFSEGFTMMYADVLLRRAHLPTEDSTRIAHVEHLIERYLADPGNSRFSAERVSRAAYGSRPGALGDYEASTHLQGELLATMLDLIIRDATAGRRSTDDVMRAMLDRFSGVRGFTGADLESTIASVCACSLSNFFASYVHSAHPIAFDRYLALAGLRMTVTRAPALRDGQPAIDRRIWAWSAPPDSALTIGISDPASVWGRAGVHTLDRLLSVNGAPLRTWPELRQILARAQIGDTLRLVVRAPGAAAPRTATVVVQGYDRPIVRITPIANPTARQFRVRQAWLAAQP